MTQPVPIRPIEASGPRSACIHDWLLGGVENSAPDRAAARALLAVHPHASQYARTAADYVTTELARLAEGGVYQVLDLGCGLPKPGHPTPYEVVVRHHERARVVYCDNDPMVLAHARTELDQSPGTRVVPWDLAVPGLFDDPDVRGHLDLGKPLAVVLAGVIECLDAPAAARLLHDCLSALPDGSAVIVATTVCPDLATTTLINATMARATGAAWGHLRSSAQLTALHPALHALVPPPPATGPEVTGAHAGWGSVHHPELITGTLHTARDAR